MEPAFTIIERLGGAAKVAEITGTDNGTPYRWRTPRAQGGTDGWIPLRYHRPLLDYAKREKIPLSAEEFLPTETEHNKKRKVAP